MSDDVDNHPYLAVAVGLFAVILLLIGWDIASDYAEGLDWGHVLLELAVLLAAASGIGVLFYRLYTARSALRSLARDLRAAEQAARHWRSESAGLLENLRSAIDRQFARWQLTPAEADIGLLLLQGLSHKELARTRNTSERTVREQARVLYRKAGLAGRASLSAFFLAGLLTPVQDSTQAAP